MGGNHLTFLSALMLTSLIALIGFQDARAQADLNEKMQSGQCIQKVDNCIVILDTSFSMKGSLINEKKLNLAKEAISLMADTIPDMKLMAGLRTYGQKGWAKSGRTKLVYGVAEYSKDEFKNALDKIKHTGGLSPLDLALYKAGKDLASVQGQSALIIFTDGRGMGSAQIKAATWIKEQFGEKVCIYAVLIGDNKKGKECMEKIVQEGGCGFSVNVDEISSQEGMADFVEKVFLAQTPDSDGDGIYDVNDKCPDTPEGVMVDEKGCPIDSDGDGIPDYLDKCSDTPQGVTVDETGCPLDSDGDGVPDYLDLCPGTPKGAKVDERGCWTISMDTIGFDSDKWDIKPQAYPALNEVVSILKTDLKLKIEIQGHTDNTGGEEYNKDLSEKRAQSVKDYLVQQGIEAGRLSIIGFWFSHPVKSNDTEEGRAANRRVEFQPIK